MKGTRTEEKVLYEEMVTLSNSVSKDNYTEDIPCPWYKCISILNIFQFKSHCYQHRKHEHIVCDVTSYLHSNRRFGEMFIKDKYDASKNRSNNQLQRIMSSMPQLSQKSFQDHLDLKSKKFLDLLVSFRPKSTQEHEILPGGDVSVPKTRYVCDFCNYMTTTKDALKEHKICVHEWVKLKKTKINFNCNEFEFQATKESQVKLHKMGMQKEVQYNVDENDNQTRRHGHLTRHKQSSPVKDEHDEFSYRAKQIGKEKLLNLRVHEGFKYKCDVCSIQTTTSSNLKRHIQSIHKVVQQVNCDKCSLQFTSRGNLKRHIQSAHIEIKYNCDKCSSQFTAKDNLKIHILSFHEGVKYSCDKCSSQFTTRKFLKVHILGAHKGVHGGTLTQMEDQTVYGEEDGYDYGGYEEGYDGMEGTVDGDTSKGLPLQGANQLCEKLFDGSFSCLSCGKVFSDQSNCKRHIKINHLGENKNTICPNCNKQVLKTYISSHIKKYCSSRPLYHDDEAGN